MARAKELFDELKRLRPQRKFDDKADDAYERLQDLIIEEFGSSEEFQQALAAEGVVLDDSDVIPPDDQRADQRAIDAATALVGRQPAVSPPPVSTFDVEAELQRRAVPPAQAEIERQGATPAASLGLRGDQIQSEIDRLNLRGTPSLGLDQIPAADLQALAAANTRQGLPGRVLAAASVSPQLLFAGDAAARAVPPPPAPRRSTQVAAATPPPPPPVALAAPAPAPVALAAPAPVALVAPAPVDQPPPPPPPVALAAPAPAREALAAPAPARVDQPPPPPRLTTVPEHPDRPAVAQPNQFAELSGRPGGPRAPAVAPAAARPLLPTPAWGAGVPPGLQAGVDGDGVPPPPPPVPAAARGREPLIDFKENPLGAIGLVLSNIAAGYEGRELPTTKLRRIRVQQEAASLNKLQLGLNMQAQILKSTDHLFGDAREAAIRKQSAPIVRLLGQDFLDGVLAASQRDPGRFNPTLHSELLPAIMGPSGPCGYARGGAAQSECFLKIVGDEDTLAALYQVHDDNNAQDYTDELSAVQEELMKHPAGPQLMKALRDKYPGGGNIPLSDYIKILDAVPGRFGVSNETIQALRRNPARYGFMGEGAEAKLQANVLENQLTRDDAIVRAQVRLNAALSTQGGRVPVVTEVRDAIIESLKARGLTVSASGLPAFTAMAEARIAMGAATSEEAFAEAEAAHLTATNRLDPPNDTSRLAQIRLAQADLERLDAEEKTIRERYADQVDFPPDVQAQLDAINSDKVVNANLITFLTHGENLTPEDRQRARQTILRRFDDTTIAPFIIRNILGLPTDMTNQQVREAGLAHELTEAQSTALPQAAAGAQVFHRMAEALARQIEAGGDVSVGLAGGTSILVDEMVHGARGIFALATGISGADEARQQEFLALPDDGKHTLDERGNMLDDDGNKIVSETSVDLSDVRHYEDILDERGFSVAQQRRLGRSADEAAKIRARVIALAFTLARSEEGGRLTDQDIKYAIRRLGVSSNARRFAAVLRQTISDVQEKYRITVKNTLGAMPVSPYLSPEDVEVLGGTGAVISIRSLSDEAAGRLSLQAQKWIALLLEGGYKDIEVGGVNVDG